jgi:ABC-2 type transport system ATP-binding protein
VRSRVGYVSEDDALVPGLTAVEFVGLAGELAGMPRKDAHRRAHEVLAYLGVEESRYRAVESLSTGVRRRVQLAQALVHDPDLLILDEPTNGLDPGGRRAMLSLVRSLSRDFGKSVILSSHLLDDVDLVCDSVVILDRGKVLASGRIDVLRAHLRNAYRVRLSGDPGSFLRRLEAAGVSAERASRPGAEVSEYVIDLPAGLGSRFLLETIEAKTIEAKTLDSRTIEAKTIEAKTLDSRTIEALDSSAGPPSLRGLELEDEKLEDIFRRILRSREGCDAR